MPLANNVNRDVFETFYLKRPSKSSHSSKSSNDSIRGADDLAPSHVRSSLILPSNSKSQSHFGGKSSSIRSDKFKPRQYLFGSTFDRKAKDEPEKENIYKNNHRNNNNNNNNNFNTTNNHNNNNSDRFKTITINSLRRSFRDSFLDSTKPAKGREHQQLWFIDVNDKREKTPTKSRENQEKLSKTSNWHPINDFNDEDDKYDGGGRRRVKRNETFRVDNNGIENERRNTSLSRHETFRVNKDRSPLPPPLRSPSVESNGSSTMNSIRAPIKASANRKMVPIAVTAPYSASNDADYPSSSLLNRKHFGGLKNTDHNRYNDSDHEDSAPNYRHDDEVSNSRDHSPIRFNKSHQFAPRTNSTTKTIIEIKAPQNDEYNYTSRDPFESRSIPERQSFNDFNTTFDRPSANRSYASLRTKFEQSGQHNRPKFSNKSYDTVDTREGNDIDLYIPSRPKPTEPWRNISSRQLSDNTTNRSFVPYRSNIDRYDDQKFTPKTTNSNRTTINIDYNYRTNPTSSRQSYDPTKNVQRTEQPQRHAFSIPLTTDKAPPAIKTKPNKNRSVKFPSVEAEVRLISPNYDTKPRRKESWKSKPANDWTFNKVHL